MFAHFDDNLFFLYWVEYSFRFSVSKNIRIWKTVPPNFYFYLSAVSNSNSVAMPKAAFVFEFIIRKKLVSTMSLPI